MFFSRHTKRRTFIAGIGSAAAWPVVARAQQPERMRRIGVLVNASATDPEYQSYLAAFRQGLCQLGWTEGQNLRIDVRWNAGEGVLASTYAAQLMGLMPDVILASSTANLTAIQQASNIAPVIFVGILDPVAQGFVASMRQPSGNLTGFSLLEISLGGKWLDLLKNAAPGLERVAIMFDPETDPYWRFLMQAIESAAPSLGVQAIAVPVRATADIEPMLATFARQPNGGLARLHKKLIADLAGRYRLPSIGTGAGLAKEGGLMDYGPKVDLVAQFRPAEQLQLFRPQFAG
jgi:putative ABC transport system substrate-binding protein